MEHQFWQNKWQKNEIGFHLPQANPLLIDNFHYLDLSPGATVLVPLCGKTIDIHWLLAMGMHVIGIELIESAVEQLFGELSLTPDVVQCDAIRMYRAGKLTVFVGDMFDIKNDNFPSIDAVYDRAALVALPEPMRSLYVEKLLVLSKHSPQLIVTLEYDEAIANGPPFSISQDRLYSKYRESFVISHLSKTPVEGGMKGKCPAVEDVWHLTPK